MIPALFIYLFKANVSLALFCVIYYTVLHRLTFVKGNRLFLLGGALCALLLPMVPVDALLAKHETLQQTVIYYLPALPVYVAPVTPWPWIAATWLFWIGITVMVIRFSIQLYSLRRLHNCAQRKEIIGYDVYALQKQVSPFSFFRNIYLNPDLHEAQLLPGILRHESVHVRQWHSIDIMLGAFVQIFAWFNPAAWLLQHAIRENLEFITDRTLLQEGVDRKQYQFSLLQVNGIPTATAIATNFNFSSLKNRIMMMNKKRSPQYQVLRYTIPVLASIVLLLSLNASRASLMPVKAKITSVFGADNDTLAPVKQKTTGLPEVTVAPLDKTKPGKKTASDKDVKHVVMRSTVPVVVDSSNRIVIQPGAATQRISTTGDVTFSTQPSSNPQTIVFGKAETTQRIFVRDTVINDANGKTVSSGKPQVVVTKIHKEPSLCLVDGKEITLQQLYAMSPDTIESMTVWTGTEAISRYGQKAEKGAIEIKTKGH